MKIFSIYTGIGNKDELKAVEKYRSDAKKAQGRVTGQTAFIPNMNPDDTVFWTPNDDAPSNRPKLEMYQPEDETVFVASRYILPKRKSTILQR